MSDTILIPGQNVPAPGLLLPDRVVAEREAHRAQTERLQAVQKEMALRNQMRQAMIGNARRTLETYSQLDRPLTAKERRKVPFLIEVATDNAPRDTRRAILHDLGLLPSQLLPEPAAPPEPSSEANEAA